MKGEKVSILINLNDARKKLNELEGSTEYNKGVTDVFNALFDLPTINAAPIKHGRWIYDDEAYPGGNPYGHYNCDQCGESVPHKTIYCPNCGARMDEVEE